VTATSANPVTGSVLLVYDPSVISSSRVIDLLAAHGYVLRATEVEAEAGNRWADKMASVAMDWMIKCTRRAARAGRHHRTGLIPDRAMQVKQRFATYYRAAAARGRSLLTKATTPWHEICRRVGRPR
jgi:hypothetical protein